MGNVVEFRRRRSREQSTESSVADARPSAVETLSFSGTIDAGSYGELFRTIVNPLNLMQPGLVTLDVVIRAEIESERGSAKSEATLRRMKESAAALGLKMIRSTKGAMGTAGEAATDRPH